MGIFIDRSNVNGADDLRKAGVSDIYLKATEGTTFRDGTYQQRRAQARLAGARSGAYHFARQNTPATEADFFLTTIGTPKPGDLRPCLDLEDGQSTAWAEAFVKHVRDSLGYWPVLYGSTSFIAPMRAASQTLRNCAWWRAEYGQNDGKRHALDGGDQGAAAHQYTSAATFPGIAGKTDASVILHGKNLVVPAAKPRKRYVIKRDGDVVGHTNHYRAWLRIHRPFAHGGHDLTIHRRST